MREYLPCSAFIFAILLPLTASSAIYKYIDENGRVAYSDKPVAGADQIKVQRAPERSQKLAKDDGDDSDENIGVDGDVARYESLRILNPEPNQSINDQSGTVQVILLPTPALSRSHEIVINVDGKDISRGRHSSLSLTNLTRGSHSVSGRIVDAEGYNMIESGTVTFHVRKTGQDDTLSLR